MLNVRRIRKNFPTYKKAIAARQNLDIEYLEEECEGQTVWTTLTHDQNRDAIAAINRLKHTHSKRTLSFAVDYFLQHYKEAADFMKWLETYKGPENKDGTFWGKPGCMVPYYALTFLRASARTGRTGKSKNYRPRIFDSIPA